MNKFITKIAALSVGLAMAIGVGVAVGSGRNNLKEAKAEDVLDYTLNGTITGGTNGYATESDITQNEISWKVTGNTTQNPWRIGGKKLTNVDREIYSTEAVSSENIDKVVVEIGNVTNGSGGNITFNSLTMKVGNAQKGNSAYSYTYSSVSANTSYTFQKTDSASWANSYFTFILNISESNNVNSYVQFKNAKFYHAEAEVPFGDLDSVVINHSADKTVFYVNDVFSSEGLTLTASDGTNTKTVSSGFTCGNGTNASYYDGRTLTSDDKGTKTVTVSYQDKDGGPTKTDTYTITVVDIEHAGTLADPYSVSDAIVKAKGVGTSATGSNKYYVTGNLKSRTAFNSTYGNYDTVVITDTSDSTREFTLYRLYADANKTKFDSNLLPANGTTIVVYGDIFNYGGTTPEMAEGCYIYSKKPASLSCTSVSGSFEVGDNPDIDDLGITVTVTYDDGSTQDVTNSATIKSGLPLVKGNNTLSISYSEEHTYSKVSKEVTYDSLTVSNVIQPVTSVEITSEVNQVNIGETITITANALPADANNKTLTWSSSDANVATIDSSTGVVTGVAAGSATITATSSNNKTASITVLVKDPTDIPTDLIISGELTKSTYYVGENFNPEGLVATLKMAKSADVIVTGSVDWSPSTLNTAGEAIEVTGSYTLGAVTVSDTVNVAVVERTVSSITITTSPTKNEYVIGIDDTSSLDLSGLVVTATYVLGDTAVVTNSISVSEVDLSSEGEKTVTVSFGGKSTSFVVTVRQANCPLTVGKQYVLAAYDKKNDKYFELTGISSTSTKYGVGTQYKTEGKTNYPLADDMVLTAEQGVEDNSVAFKTSSNKYLTWASGNSLNVADEKDSDGHTSWTISYETSELTGIEYAIITNVNSSARKIWWNVSNPRFAAYDGEKTYETDSYGGVMLYSFEYCKAGNFVDGYMHPEIETTDDGAGNNYQTCKGTGYYDAAKPAFNALPLVVRQELAKTTFEFYPYYQRLLWWADVNGDRMVDNELVTKTPSNNSISFINADGTNNIITVIVVISLVSLTAVGGYFLLKKKKEQ